MTRTDRPVIVTLHDARGLTSMDLFGKMDPYVIVQLGDQKQKTSVHKKGGCKPRWEEELVFRMCGAEKLKFTIMDKDTLTPDDTVGTGSLDLQEIIEGVPEDHEGKKKYSAEIPILRDRNRQGGYLRLTVCIAADPNRPPPSPVSLGPPPNVAVCPPGPGGPPPYPNNPYGPPHPGGYPGPGGYQHMPSGGGGYHQGPPGGYPPYQNLPSNGPAPGYNPYPPHGGYHQMPSGGGPYPQAGQYPPHAGQYPPPHGQHY